MAYDIIPINTPVPTEKGQPLTIQRHGRSEGIQPGKSIDYLLWNERTAELHVQNPDTYRLLSDQGRHNNLLVGFEGTARAARIVANSPLHYAGRTIIQADGIEYAITLDGKLTSKELKHILPLSALAAIPHTGVIRLEIGGLLGDTGKRAVIDENEDEEPEWRCVGYTLEDMKKNRQTAENALKKYAQPFSPGLSLVALYTEEAIGALATRGAGMMFFDVASVQPSTWSFGRVVSKIFGRD